VSRRISFAAFLAVAALGAGALTGCSLLPGAEPTESPSVTPTTAPAEGDLANDGEFNADGTAADNLDIFTSVMNTVWASDEKAQGRAYVDSLVEAGFDKSQMQVTEDLSTVQLAAESIMFSVKWGDECLVGQVGPDTGEPVAAVEDVVAGGVCLMGNTREIDW